MTISLEKILTISAEEWSKIESSALFDYKAEGVHYHGAASDEDVDVHAGFASVVPDNAEVVVSYRFNIALAGTGGRLNCNLSAGGTALIPKEKK